MKPLIKMIVWGVALSTFWSSIMYNANAQNDGFCLRPVSYLEKQNRAAVPYTTDTAEFKNLVSEWLDENELHKRYGRWQLLQEGKGNVRIKVTLHGVDYGREKVVIDIVPRNKRVIADYGSYEAGIECLEGALPLCRALKNAGYEAFLMACATGFLKEHVYVKVRIGGRLIMISTTPDMETFDFKDVRNERELPWSRAQEDFAGYAAAIPFDREGLAPMMLFRSSEGKRFSIAARMAHEPSKPFPLRMEMRSYDLETGKFIRYSIGVEPARLTAFRNWVLLNESKKGRLFKVISSEKSEGGLRFVFLNIPYEASGRTGQELEEACSLILYDVFVNLALELPNGAATSFAQAETIPAPLAGGLNMEPAAALAVTSI
jgi:hypothetical protein